MTTPTGTTPAYTVVLHGTAKQIPTIGVLRDLGYQLLEGKIILDTIRTSPVAVMVGVDRATAASVVTSLEASGSVVEIVEENAARTAMVVARHGRPDLHAPPPPDPEEGRRQRRAFARGSYEQHWRPGDLRGSMRYGFSVAKGLLRECPPDDLRGMDTGLREMVAFGVALVLKGRFREDATRVANHPAAEDAAVVLHIDGTAHAFSLSEPSDDGSVELTDEVWLSALWGACVIHDREAIALLAGAPAVLDARLDRSAEWRAVVAAMLGAIGTGRSHEIPELPSDSAARPVLAAIAALAAGDGAGFEVAVLRAAPQPWLESPFPLCDMTTTPFAPLGSSPEPRLTLTALCALARDRGFPLSTIPSAIQHRFEGSRIEVELRLPILYARHDAEVDMWFAKRGIERSQTEHEQTMRAGILVDRYRIHGWPLAPRAYADFLIRPESYPMPDHLLLFRAMATDVVDAYDAERAAEQARIEAFVPLAEATAADYGASWLNVQTSDDDVRESPDDFLEWPAWRLSVNGEQGMAQQRLEVIRWNVLSDGFTQTIEDFAEVTVALLRPSFDAGITIVVDGTRYECRVAPELDADASFRALYDAANAKLLAELVAIARTDRARTAAQLIASIDHEKLAAAMVWSLEPTPRLRFVRISEFEMND